MRSVARKKMPVQEIIEEANRLLALQDNKTVNADFRRGVAALTEQILFASKNYAGFNYVAWTDEGGHEAWKAAGEPGFPEKERFLGDPTRRFYYPHHRLAPSHVNRDEANLAKLFPWRV